MKDKPMFTLDELPPDIEWRKAQRSSDGSSCVGLARVQRDGTPYFLLRDSRNPQGPILTFDQAEWDAFVDGVNNNEFDLSTAP